MGLQLKRAIAVVMRTKPYVLYRALIYGALCLCVIGYLGLLAIIGLVFGSGAFWALLVVSVGLVAMLGVAGFVGDYIFYRLRAGHIALITEIIAEGQLPTGISQMKWARGRVLHYFGSVSPLPQVLWLVRAIVRAANRTLFDSAAALPVPGIECGTKFSQHLVDFSQGYVEEALIAYVFKSKEDNLFAAAQAGLVAYCQSWKTVLGNAVMLTLWSYCFVLLATVLFLIPLGIVAWILPAEWTIFKFTLFATGVFLGFAAKWSLYDPVASASTILAFLEESDLTTPEPEWEPKLESACEAFGELKRKAEDQAAGSKTKKPSKRPRTKRPPAVRL